MSPSLFSKKTRVVTKVVNVGDPTRAHLDGHDHDGHENGSCWGKASHFFIMIHGVHHRSTSIIASWSGCAGDDGA